MLVGLYWIEQRFTFPPTQGIWETVFRPNQQYQSTAGTNSTQTNQNTISRHEHKTQQVPPVYNNMGGLGDGSHRGQGCQVANVRPIVYNVVWFTQRMSLRNRK